MTITVLNPTTGELVTITVAKALAPDKSTEEGHASRRLICRSSPPSPREGFTLAMAFAIGLSLAAPLNFFLS
jgi:hypothetical protein